ncbi:hypothetical protein [Prauserella rugosa]|uniref:Uncharacterized protein n=1 Tax=Prauserella rugosa TaxID=43354 RepID=A0A660C9W2_9PSEU|nr:hypothetical protein [Prauserella rugosa]TWH20358.1 hypothetical protein JD82_02204 [Prauserella rugosa]
MSAYPHPQPHPSAVAERRPPKFVALAWAGLILGIVGVVGSPVIIVNNITAIAAAVGFVLGLIGFFGTRKIVAGIGVVLCAAAVVITVLVQKNVVDELDRISRDVGASFDAAPTDVGSAPSLPAPSPVDEIAQPETNERNYLPMNVGDEAWTGPVGDEGGGSGTSFTVDRIELDPGCDAYGLPPESGHTLVLHVRVATGDDQMSAMDAAGVLNPYNFVEIDSSGVSHRAEFGTCTAPEKALPMNFGVNQKYSGTIELVVPEASGTLALDPGTLINGPAGWEWTY